jgi:ACR3 family arsenite transporter
LDRFLPVWIFLAVVIGVVIGYFAPGVHTAFATGGEVQGVAAPLVVGLIVMMWPILTKVQYERGKELVQSRRVWTQICVSLLLNWIAGPFIMLALAWATLPDLATYRAGIILVGVARCIAMVNIWVSLAKGDCDVCALVVIVNSLLQIVLFSPYSIFLINVISDADSLSLDYSHTAIAVALYLGVPLAAGLVTRFSLIFLMGKQRFQHHFLPYFGALSLVALLYVVIVIFALQARRVLDNIGPVFRCFVPLVLYFTIMWVGTFVLCWRLSRKYSRTFDYQMTVVQAFTAGSNNFELAIAIAVSAYGAGSDQALAATIGPFVEIPVLLALTYVSLWLGKKWTWGSKAVGDDVEGAAPAEEKA